LRSLLFLKVLRRLLIGKPHKSFLFITTDYRILVKHQHLSVIIR